MVYLWYLVRFRSFNLLVSIIYLHNYVTISRRIANRTQRDPFTLIKVAYNAPDTTLVFSGRGFHVTYHIYAGIVTLTGVPPQGLVGGGVHFPVLG